MGLACRIGCKFEDAQWTDGSGRTAEVVAIDSVVSPGRLRAMALYASDSVVQT